MMEAALGSTLTLLVKVRESHDTKFRSAPERQANQHHEATGVDTFALSTGLEL